MEFFKKLRVTNAVQRLEEEALYAAVVNELSAGIKREGLWGKALVDARGDESHAKSLYLKYRAQSMLDEQVLAEAVTQSLARSTGLSSGSETRVESQSMKQGSTEDYKARISAAKRKLSEKGFSVNFNDQQEWEVRSKSVDQRHKATTLDELERYAERL